MFSLYKTLPPASARGEGLWRGGKGSLSELQVVQHPLVLGL